MAKWIIAAVLGFVGLLVLAVVAATVLVVVVAPWRYTAYAEEWHATGIHGLQWGPTSDDGVHWGPGGHVGFGNTEVSTEVTKSLTVTTPVEVNVENTFGHVNVRTGRDGEVKVEATIRAWGRDSYDAQSTLDQARVDLSQSSGRVEIQTYFPNADTVLDVSNEVKPIDLVVYVPPDANVQQSSADDSVRIHTGGIDLSIESN
jgi:hypothetical protein